MKPESCLVSIIVIYIFCPLKPSVGTDKQHSTVKKQTENETSVTETQNSATSERCYSLKTQVTQDIGKLLSSQILQANKSMVIRFSSFVNTSKDTLRLRGIVNDTEGARRRKRYNVKFQEKDGKRESWVKKEIPGKNPYVVLVRRCKGEVGKRCDDQLGSCTGSLITLQWVLTSATCVSPTSYTYMEVFAGGCSTRLTAQNRAPDGMQKRFAKKEGRGYYPAEFDPDKFSILGYYDVGLVKANEPFQESNVVKPIGISRHPWQYDSYIGCKVTGLAGIEGSTNKYEHATYDVLVKVPCVDNKMCTKWEDDAPGDPAMRICAEPWKGLGVCENVKGASLVCAGKIRGVFSQGVAINTWDSASTRVCEANKYPNVKCGFTNYTSMYTNICYSVGFINMYTKFMPGYQVPQNCDGRVASKQKSDTSGASYSLPSSFVMFGFCLFKLYMFSF